MNKIVKFSVLNLALLYALIGVSSAAQKSPDITKGKAKSAACAACHGARGVSTNSLWPHLAGQNKDYLVKQLHDFKTGKRSDPVMSGMAKPLSNEDINNLAAYFSSLN
ncbi:cytochrome c, class I [Paraglaciecola sp. T6c]|uniref:c-type cytochrome n=1 Tax=Pseudoalteromonas atlantica (strain T6c / ATCC BAA-1087) TaxID=3042615 RepID=UPI00005C6890|nr:cytochrome c [Paraglaciecola sp. T6c]ABG42408.1 cytochrome c, class I [Paraglaciecola sp. T6c]